MLRHALTRLTPLLPPVSMLVLLLAPAPSGAASPWALRVRTSATPDRYAGLSHDLSVRLGAERRLGSHWLILGETGASRYSSGGAPVIRPEALCVDCGYYSARRSADLVPVAFGLRFDAIAPENGRTTPFIEVLPTIYLARFSNTREELYQSATPFAATRTVEDIWIGGLLGFQGRAGMHFSLKGSAGLDVALQYGRSEDSGPAASDIRTLNSFDWSENSGFRKGLRETSLTIGFSLR